MEVLMFGRKKEDKGIDYPKLNEVINLSKNILKIILILGIVSLIILGSYIIREWKLLVLLLRGCLILLLLFSRRKGLIVCYQLVLFLHYLLL